VSLLCRQKLLAQFVFFNLAEDVLFYWIHRFLHRPWWMKHVHKVHHSHHAPYSVAGAQAHWFEALFNFLLPTVLPPLIAGW
jgi:sterol desaturase/sphingolipid hydroxylase (fatty acid hydroxylase superfamily)